MSETIKVDLREGPKNPTEDAVIKVDLREDPKPTEDADSKPKADDDAEPVTPELDEVITIGEVTDDEPAVKPAEPVPTVPQLELPENVEKLVNFMQETGGTVQDYVRLNADYSNVDQDTLLKEYYKQTKSHLDQEEIGFLMEDRFDFDEDIDEERDIRAKKLAKKEEVAKAKKFLEGVKDKYYSEIKMKPGLSADQQKASDFFNRYTEEQQLAEQQHSAFKENTKQMFSQDFKGFDFKLGEKTFRYGIQNTEKVAERQSNLNNLIGKFLNDKGEVTDTKGYHKAIYAAENADTIAKHFYEQGKSDAVKEVMAKSKNTTVEARSTAPSDVTIGGFQVRSINGVDSSKLRIKKKIN
jgi:hypothetical protein